MSKCNLDHTPEDVQKKFEQQRGFLPEDMQPLFQAFFQQEHTQDILNEVFHLLKKFDLASDEERTERVSRLYLVLKNL